MPAPSIQMKQKPQKFSQHLDETQRMMKHFPSIAFVANGIIMYMHTCIRTRVFM